MKFLFNTCNKKKLFKHPKVNKINKFYVAKLLSADFCFITSGNSKIKYLYKRSEIFFKIKDFK